MSNETIMTWKMLAEEIQKMDEYQQNCTAQIYLPKKKILCIIGHFHSQDWMFNHKENKGEEHGSGINVASG